MKITNKTQSSIVDWVVLVLIFIATIKENGSAMYFVAAYLIIKKTDEYRK